MRRTDRSNDTASQLRTDEAGDVHVTMTVLVVLAGIVAAIGGAYLLLSNTIALGDDNTERAEDAASHESTQLVIQEAYGAVDAGRVASLSLFVAPNPATNAVDISQTRLGVCPIAPERVCNETAAIDGSPYRMNIIRDRDGSLTASPPMLTRGDLVELVVDAEETGLDASRKEVLVVTQLLGENRAVTVELRPDEAGQMVRYEVIG